MWSDHFLSPAFSPTPSLSAQPPLTSRCPIPGTWVYLPNLSLEHSFCIYPCAQSYLLQVLTQICSQWCFAHYFPLSLRCACAHTQDFSFPLLLYLFFPILLISFLHAMYFTCIFNCCVIIVISSFSSSFLSDNNQVELLFSFSHIRRVSEWI